MPVPPTSLARARTLAGAGLPYLVTSGVLFGTGGLTGRLLGRAAGLPAVAVAGYRLAVGGSLILALLALTGRPRPRGRAAWTRIVVVGVLCATYQACYFASVSATSVSQATLVTVGAFPVLMTASQWWTGRRRADRTTLATTCLALAGLGLLVGLPPAGPGPAATLVGAGLAVAAAAGFTVVSVVVARPVPGLDALITTGFAFTVGGGLLLPVAAVTAGAGFHPGAVAVGLLVVLATVPTAVAYTLYFRGLPSVPAATASVVTLLEPLTGTVLATVLVGDRLGAAGILGALLLASAVFFAATGPNRRGGL